MRIAVTGATGFLGEKAKLKMDKALKREEKIEEKQEI